MKKFTIAAISLCVMGLGSFAQIPGTYMIRMQGNEIIQHKIVVQ